MDRERVRDFRVTQGKRTACLRSIAQTTMKTASQPDLPMLVE